MSRTTFVYHLTSAGIVALSVLLRVPIESWLGFGSSPLPFIASVAIASRLGGFSAGALVVLFWAAVWVCLDHPPGGSGTIRRLEDQFRVVMFLIEGGILTGVIEALNAAMRVSDKTALEFKQYREVSGRNEAKLRAILEHSLAPIWMKDLEGRYLIINHRFETLVRRSAPEVVGRTDSELSLPPIAGNLSDSDRMVIEYGRVVEVEEVIPFDDGPRTFLAVKFPLADEGGSPYAIGGILTDITELKEAQRRAVQAERLAAIGQMVAGLAHESRNALQRGQACLEMLAFRLEGSPESLELLAGIQDAQDDLHRLYEEVRCYAAPIRLEILGCRIPDVLREAWEQLGPARRGRDIHLVSGEPIESICQVDRKRLIQVFRNVLDNALGATPDPVTIEVLWSEVQLNGNLAVRVAIRDNGPGLTTEQRGRMFEPFYTTKTQGTGLGMAIARRIVEAHGGSIEVGSDDRPGAEIVIILPRRQEHSRARSSTLESLSTGGAGTVSSGPARLRAS